MVPNAPVYKPNANSTNSQYADRTFTSNFISEAGSTLKFKWVSQSNATKFKMEVAAEPIDETKTPRYYITFFYLSKSLL